MKCYNIFKRRVLKSATVFLYLYTYLSSWRATVEGEDGGRQWYAEVLLYNDTHLQQTVMYNIKVKKI